MSLFKRKNKSNEFGETVSPDVISREEHKAQEANMTSLSELHPNRKKITMIGVLLAMLLSALDQTIVGTALPRIVRDLGGLDHISWVVTAYLLASTVTVPIYGKLSDLYGRKTFFVFGIAVFLMGSVLCGLSHSMIWLIASRAIQGIGGGAIMANAFAIIGDLFTPRERAKWQGIMGGVFGLASVIGPALGGFITDHSTWRWVFYINLPLGLVALGFIAFLMPHIVPENDDKTIDFLGAGTLVTTLVPLLLALVWGGSQYAWGSVQIMTMLAVSAVSLVAFIWTEHRARQPILPLDLFKNRIFVSSVTIMFLSSVAMFGAILYIPLFAQLVQGTSATKSGTIITPMMIGLITASIVSGQIVSRTGKYRWIVIIGMAVSTLAMLWLSTVTVSTTTVGLAARMVCLGLGLGSSMSIFNTIVQNAFDRSRLGVVTASVQLFRNIGSTVGTAVLGGIFNSNLTHKAAALSNTDFGHYAAQLKLPLLPLDADKLQGIMSADGKAQVYGALAKLPSGYADPIATAFNSFLASARGVFASSVAHVFLVGTVISAAALVVSLALKQIPLQAQPKKADSPDQTGKEMAVKLGQAPEDSEPAL